MSTDSPNPTPVPPSGSAELPAEIAETVGLEASPAVDLGFTLSHEAILSAATGPDELGWMAHYRVLKVLGQGGMGMVFQAEDTQLQRVVALKVILPEFAANPAARERFLREARAGAALKNDHIVTIYQVGLDRDVPFLAMEFLQGQSLETRLESGEALPIREVLRIGREVAAGLAAAHEQGLIHRDIKPANIWLEAPAGRVKLLDFGLARTAGSRSNLTQTSRVIGTPEFMSPEQARGLELDPRSDLFSVGVVLYTMCTGQKPFQGSTVMAVLTALAVDAPRPIQDLNPHTPLPLVELVARLLEKEPAHRPASAQEVQQTLEAVAAGVPALTTTELQHAATRPVPVVQPASPNATTGQPAGVRHSRRAMVVAGLAGAVVLAGVALWSLFGPKNAAEQPATAPGGPPLRIGVLHSRTGTMAISERPVIDAVLLAVEEINAQGGLLGRSIEPVLADGQSDEQVFARQAEKLITQDKVCAIFGCWTSASRKAVLPVVEKHGHLLFYPVQYEGMEQSPNIVYGGPVPNQQILPALRWLVGFEGKKRWFLVGSDYVFPVTANAVIRDEAKARGCEIVGEAYVLLASTDVAGVLRQIEQASPDLIINTINGDTNVAFFRALRRAGIQSKALPTLSLSISEEELSALGPRDIAGDYVAGNYFQTLELAQNQEFLQRFGRHYGPERVMSSAMQTAYNSVHLWAQAVRSAARDDPRAIRDAVKSQKREAPQGPIQIEPVTLHTIQFARVGRISEEGRLVEVYRSPQPIQPEPFPHSRRRDEWLAFLNGLHQRWGGRWSNLGP